MEGRRCRSGRAVSSNVGPTLRSRRRGVGGPSLSRERPVDPGAGKLTLGSYPQSVDGVVPGQRPHGSAAREKFATLRAGYPQRITCVSTVLPVSIHSIPAGNTTASGATGGTLSDPGGTLRS